MNPVFLTPGIAALWEAVRPYSHPEFPFCHPRYSVSSCTPCVDFTQPIADWMERGCWGEIAELWACLSGDGEADRLLLRKILPQRFPDWLPLPAWMQWELRAINLLAQRAGLSSAARDMAWAASQLAACTLAAGQVNLAADRADVIYRAARVEVNENCFPGSVMGRDEAVRSAIEMAVKPPPSEVGNMTALAPTTRLAMCLTNWGAMDFSLSYPRRMYGSNTEINVALLARFIAEPTDGDKVPAVATKAILLPELAKRGLACPPSATRKAMIEILRTMPGAVMEIIKAFAPDRRKVRQGCGIGEWDARVKYLQPVGAALLKLLQ